MNQRDWLGPVTMVTRHEIDLCLRLEQSWWCGFRAGRTESHRCYVWGAIRDLIISY